MAKKKSKNKATQPGDAKVVATSQTPKNKTKVDTKPKNNPKNKAAQPQDAKKPINDPKNTTTQQQKAKIVTAPQKVKIEAGNNKTPQKGPKNTVTAKDAKAAIPPLPQKAKTETGKPEIKKKLEQGSTNTVTLPLDAKAATTTATTTTTTTQKVKTEAEINKTPGKAPKNTATQPQHDKVADTVQKVKAKTGTETMSKTNPKDTKRQFQDAHFATGLRVLEDEIHKDVRASHEGKSNMSVEEIKLRYLRLYPGQEKYICDVLKQYIALLEKSGPVSGLPQAKGEGRQGGGLQNNTPEVKETKQPNASTLHCYSTSTSSPAQATIGRVEPDKLDQEQKGSSILRHFIKYFASPNSSSGNQTVPPSLPKVPTLEQQRAFLNLNDKSQTADGRTSLRPHETVLLSPVAESHGFTLPPQFALLGHQLSKQSTALDPRIPVTVLVSPSNFYNLENMYSRIPGIKVLPFRLQPKQLNISSMLSLMSLGKRDNMPLYMVQVTQVLREMAMNSKRPFDYVDFRTRLDALHLDRSQTTFLDQRFNLLESFLDLTGNTSENYFVDQGVTILDLSCPFVDQGTACTLFRIAIDIFLHSYSSRGKMIVADEAHKYMVDTPAAKELTDTFLNIIRQQRHLGARLIISTQEPTISPRLIDLCSMTIIHRFSSPDWYDVIRKHVTISDKESSSRSANDGDNGDGLYQISSLRTGEALVFAPSAFLLDGNKAQIDTKHKVFKLAVRKRITWDGGQSILCV
ncbi:uncharacterized protein GIQ15_04909 [Arthroderma uncinatum]|uniref:uncharacterized protein n=1 Tax=Arthroderma uncinatum TaxID=74035 RepID=UPI00144AAB70|nr:uncharacterized protein GIQ15_04909 [Arthroderma uncinatum]KAF3482150.1 hypothetical protein GIQ15_04909 [Arthroderma uncinatum]